MAYSTLMGQHTDQCFPATANNRIAFPCPGLAISKDLHQLCFECHILTLITLPLASRTHSQWTNCGTSLLVLLCNDSEAWLVTFACFILHNGMTTCDFCHTQCPSCLARHDRINYVTCSSHKIIHYFHSISWVLCEWPFASPHLCLTAGCCAPLLHCAGGSWHPFGAAAQT